MKLHLDWETASDLDLTKVGAHVYAQHPSTRIHCLGWAINDADPQIWIPGTDMPDELKDALQHADCYAWNAQFERLIFEYVLPRYGDYPRPTWRQWRCVAAQARVSGLPGKLAKAAEALHLEQQKQDNRLMIKLSQADYTPTIAELHGLYGYCKQDVVVERGIEETIPALSDDEQFIYELNERINDVGVRVDMSFAECMLNLLDQEVTTLNAELNRLTNGQVTALTQVERIKDVLGWVGSLDAPTIERLLEHPNLDDYARRILEIRQAGAKSSTAKYKTMRLQGACDGRLRGQFIYAGAGTTGRFSGKGVQLHNLPRRVPGDAENMIQLIKDGLPLERFKLLYGADFMSTASQLIRPALIADPGKTFIIGDFSAVEARGLPYLAGERPEIDAWAAGTDRYIEDAADVFRIPLDAVTDEQRQAGKVVRLACGFGGKKGALLAMAKSYGMALTPFEADRMANAWHEANPWAISFGKRLERAALAAMEQPGRVVAVGAHIMYASEFIDDMQVLRCRLSSGRILSYHDVKIVEGSFGHPVVERLHPSKTVRDEMWYGLYAENVTQAFCNDLMRHAMVLIDTAGYHIVAHVHDETVEEVPAADAERARDEIQQLMETRPPYATDFPLVAKVGISNRYTK